MGRKKEKKPLKILTLDTETRGLFGEVFRVGLYDIFTTEYWVGNKYKEIHPILQKLSQTYDVHVYIHNLDFDFSKILQELMTGWDFENGLVINNRSVTIPIEGFTLHDSLSLVMGSLKRLCVDFDLPEEYSKMDLETWVKDNLEPPPDRELLDWYFSTVDPEDETLNKYLKLDCVSLGLILKILIEISELELDKFVRCPTTASLAMSVYRNNYSKDFKLAVSTNYESKLGRFIEGFIRQGYYGGRTEVFRPFLENGFHYDVNSLYPAVMEMYEFPIGFPEVHNSDLWSIWDSWRFTGRGAGMIFAKVEIPDTFIPPLPIRHRFKTGQGEKLIFPTGKVQGTWTLHELHNAMKHGVKLIEIEQIIYWKKTAPIFKGYVEHFKDMKMNSKGAKRSFAKLMQNSLYGKFGMRRERVCYYPVEMKEELYNQKIPYLEIIHPQTGITFLEAMAEVEVDYIQPHISAYVTSYARILLFNALVEQEKNGAVYYCDTDSIAGKKEFPLDLVDDKVYGKWKLETVIDKAVFIQPKLYFEKGIDDKGKPVETRKAKGIPKKHVKAKFNEEYYNHIVNRIRHGKQKLKKGKFLTEHEKRIIIFEAEEGKRKVLTALKSGKDIEEKTVLSKSINLLSIQKRELDFINNTSKPHKLEMF